MIECCNCGLVFPPEHSRWLCPFCKFKNSCCEGSALPDQCAIVEHVNKSIERRD